MRLFRMRKPAEAACRLEVRGGNSVASGVPPGPAAAGHRHAGTHGARFLTRRPADPITRPAAPFFAVIAVAIVLLATLVRLGLATGNAGLTMDSPLYVSMADSLAKGAKAVGPAHHGYPALVALAGLVLPGRELPGRAVSLLSGLVLVGLVYLVARRNAPPWAAAIAAGLTALHPLLAVYSGPIMTESTFLVLLLAALLALEHQRSLAAGLALGLSYVVRPEGLVVVIGAILLGGLRWRRAARIAAGFAMVAAPYVGYLSWERGAFTLTPKEALVHAPTPGRSAEWRIQDPANPPVAAAPTLFERFRQAAPGIAARYLPRLGGHLTRLSESWPWPLLLLSVAGLILRPGPVASPLLQLLVIPMLAVLPEPRFALLYLPSLAVLAAVGAAEWTARMPRRRTAVALAIALAILASVLSVWTGRAARHALHFDDGPMKEMRAAGAWLRARGVAGDVVMDRKAYVPFFAGMRHIQLPDDDYETILEYACRSGARYMVLEEYVVESLRPQLRPLLGDARFRDAERRLRPVFHVRGSPHSGVAVMEVVPAAAEGSRPAEEPPTTGLDRGP